MLYLWPDDHFSRNPRDKIYGILGLVDVSIATLVVPNYSLPTSQTFLDFTKNVIEATGILDIICATRHIVSQLEGSSWVPDFESPQEPNVEFTLKSEGGGACLWDYETYNSVP